MVRILTGPMKIFNFVMIRVSKRPIVEACGNPIYTVTLDQKS